MRAGFGIFYTPIDMNTWCNHAAQRAHHLFRRRIKATPSCPSITSFNFAAAVLGRTVTSFTGFDPSSRTIRSTVDSLTSKRAWAKKPTLEVGYQATRGLHLQRSHLINNALPGPGLIQPRRPYGSLTFLPGTVFPAGATVVEPHVPGQHRELAGEYGPELVRLRLCQHPPALFSGLSLLTNYTFAKNLSDAPDFRSPMFEASVPQNNNDLAAEKGPACDIRHRF